MAAERHHTSAGGLERSATSWVDFCTDLLISGTYDLVIIEQLNALKACSTGFAHFGIEQLCRCASQGLNAMYMNSCGCRFVGACDEIGRH